MIYTRLICSIGCVLGMMGLPVVQAAPPPQPLPLERPMLKVDSNGRYRVVYDIHSDEMMAGVSKGLYFARGLIEAFRKQGVAPSQLDIHLVLHGDAARYLLVDDTYRTLVEDPFAVNQSANITQALLDLGASVEICHSVMNTMGWTASDVLPGVTIVHDGYTRLVKLQNDGYAYIGGF